MCFSSNLIPFSSDADRAPQLKAIYKACQEKKERTYPRGAVMVFVFTFQHPVVCFSNLVRVIAPLYTAFVFAFAFALPLVCLCSCVALHGSLPHRRGSNHLFEPLPLMKQNTHSSAE
ncbi:MAG: hypothetical protein LC776_10935, partial [Acidobacteria bacterium]|nr:hypothetical protein [Acidobacteriota bacterium]